MVHAVEPVLPSKYPAAQLLHTVFAVDAENLPAGQLSQADAEEAPAAIDAVPTAHAVQLVDPVKSA
jgi:hypothetical protein